MRARALAVLLLAAPLAGCFEISAAHVPEARLDAAAWRENVTAERSESAWGGLSRVEARVFEHPRGSTGYAGTLSVTTLRAFLEPDESDLRDQLAGRVRQASEARGIAIEGEAVEGSRDNGEKRATVYFTFRGTSVSSDPLFTRNADVRIVGEVWNCREARTVVVAVGLAQTNDVRTIGGIAVPSNPDLRTWSALVADPSGAIEGHRGSGLLHSIVCT